jgi:hypothetical protein
MQFRAVIGEKIEVRRARTTSAAKSSIYILCCEIQKTFTENHDFV